MVALYFSPGKQASNVRVLTATEFFVGIESVIGRFAKLCAYRDCAYGGTIEMRRR